MLKKRLKSFQEDNSRTLVQIHLKMYLKGEEMSKIKRLGVKNIVSPGG